MKGKFIVIEGPDGSGKTTVSQAIIDHYKAQGVKVLHTREPGGTPIGEEIRQILLDPKNKAMDPKAEALLYAASRAQHVEEKIKPALDQGYIVICERYIFSSLVYQGLSRELGVDNISRINEFATQDLEPDIVIYLDPGDVVARDRILDRALDRLEEEEAFIQRVQTNYRILAQKMEDSLEIIDASQSPDQVFAACLEKIEEERKR